jgi:hypothetical protein
MPWMRILAIARVALLLKHHLDRLKPEERAELRRLVRKSKLRPRTNLSARERTELKRLVAKLEPGEFGRGAARAIILGRRGRR